MGWLHDGNGNREARQGLEGGRVDRVEFRIFQNFASWRAVEKRIHRCC